MHISACASCHRAIIWTVSPAGAMLPLDARPVTVYSFNRGMFEPTHAYKLEHDLPVYISHFLTCPNASEHSRPREPAQEPLL